MVTYNSVPFNEFRAAFESAREDSDLIREATSPITREDAADTVFHLADDGDNEPTSGFAVTSSGELRFVFSMVRGRGEGIVNHAIEAGATHLDCFDGYLPTLYAAGGFVEVKRVPNWTPGGPDVVYMALPGSDPSILTEEDAMERFNEFLDEVYGDVKLGGIGYAHSHVLEVFDPILYTEMFLDYADSEGWTIV